MPAMADAEPLPFERKILYSVAEVAAITRCHPGRVRRWIHRRQLEAVVVDDFALVPLASLLARLERVEAARARRRSGRFRRLADGPEGPADTPG
jgi:hypothetical protein